MTNESGPLLSVLEIRYLTNCNEDTAKTIQYVIEGKIAAYYKRKCHFFPSFDRDVWGDSGSKRMLAEYLAPPQPATLSTMDFPDCYECSNCAWQVKQKPPAWMKHCANCGAEIIYKVSAI